MDSSDLISSLEILDDDIDGLEAALAPLTRHALTDIASRIPLLDKAKLYVLVTYAIENILFSYLRLNGVNAKEHAVFRELTRVKQYFEKIKITENVGSKRENLILNKSAAQRMIKHALSGNNQESPKPDEHSQTSRIPQIKRKHASIGENNGEGLKPPELQNEISDDNSPRKKRKKSKQEKRSNADE